MANAVTTVAPKKGDTRYHRTGNGPRDATTYRAYKRNQMRGNRPAKPKRERLEAMKLIERKE